MATTAKKPSSAGVTRPAPLSSAAVGRPLAKTPTRTFYGDPTAVIADMRRGTPASVIPTLANRFGMSQDGLFDVLRLPRSTMKSRISKNEALSGSEQDRMYRADRV